MVKLYRDLMPRHSLPVDRRPMLDFLAAYGYDPDDVAEIVFDGDELRITVVEPSPSGDQYLVTVVHEFEEDTDV